MREINRLKPGDKVAIVSLSSGVLGESFVKHELDLGIARLKEFGLVPVFMKNSLKGLSFISEHPESRAEDLKQAFEDKDIKMILCAIGGVDTIRTLPYLMSDKEFTETVKNSSKIFMGFSDSTVNHLMLYKLGLNTIYGPAFLTDFAELATEMLPYTKNSIEYFFNPCDNFEVKPAEYWYKDRSDFSPAAVGTDRIKVKETKGYELICGKGKVQGKLLGGCLDVLADLIGVYENEDEDGKHMIRANITKDYDVFPSLDEWNGKIMFIETSEEKMQPEYYKKIIQKLKKMGVFDKVNGVVVGKPIDEVFYDEYKQILSQELGEYEFPVLYNLNFGHAYPRAVIPYGATAEIDAQNKKFTILKTTIK